MSNNYFKTLLLLLACWLGPPQMYAQLIGASAYIIGDNVEIGINDAGHEGAPRLIGSNNRSNQALGSPVYFGFVANPQLDGWGNYDGDFFTPGSPENGFGLEIGGINYSNNASGSLEQIPGSISSYTTVGDCIFVEWDGTIANVDVHIVYRLITTELYYTTEVTLTNTGPGDLTDVYYYRNLDPDNNVTIGGGYATQNTVVAQPTPACEKALVTATQTGPWDSYIGLGAIGEEFRVSYGGFANRDASNIWNGVGGLTGGVGATAFSDQAISLAHLTETLEVGVPETFLFTVVLDATQIDAAIASLYYFDYVGGGGVIDECAPIVDTAKTCAGLPVTISVDGPSSEDYIWEWTPPVGLSTTDGPVTDASPDVTTEYVVTGTPAPLCLSATIEKTIVVQVTPSPIIEIVDPGSDCGDFDLTTLVVNNIEPGGAAVDISFFSVIPDSADQVVGLWPSDFMSEGDVVYVMMVDPVSGCYDVEPVVIDFSGGADAGDDNAETLCNNAGTTLNLNTLLIGAELGGIWEETSLVLSGGFDAGTGVLDAAGVTPGDYTFEYIALGVPPCENDTAEMVITINLEALAGLDATISLCNTAGTTTDLDDLLDGNNGIGTWLETTASGQFTAATGVFDASGLAAGDYTFTYTVGALAPCVPDVADFTVTIYPNPPVNAGDDFEICAGESATLSGTGAGVGGTYDWDGGVTDGVAFTPAATATYTVTGTDANGCINTDDILVTVNALPVIEAGDDEAICDGDATAVAGAGAGVGGTYDWTGGVTDGVDFTPAATATYTVTGTDANGCESTDEVTITVNDLPAIIAGDDAAICIGDGITLSGSGAGAGTYDWTGGVTDGVEFSPVATATYTVTGTDVNGCINTDDVIVTVNELPAVFAGADVEICEEASVTLSGSGGGMGAIYLWTGGGIDGVAFTPASSSMYTVTGTDVNGCVNTDDVMVIVNPLPVISAGDDEAICDGDATAVAGAGAGVGGTYDWTGGITDGVDFTPAATTTYTVTGTDANGCVSTDEVTITVNDLPAIIAGDDAAICIGDGTTLSGSGAGAGTYDWTGGVTDGVEFSPVATATYTVTGTDVNGCINTDDVIVTVNELPVVFAGEDVEICEEASVTLSGSGGGMGAVYLWTGGGIDGVAFTPASSSMYTVTGTDSEGCVNTDDVMVIVNPLPVINAGPDISLCIGAEAVLNATGAGIGGSYDWDGGITDGVMFEPAATATYTVIGTDDNGCVSTDDVLVTVIPLPIVEAGADQEICFGESAVLNGAGAGAGGTYEWDGGIADGIYFTPGETNIYTVTATTIDGCVNSDDVMVIVNPLPAVNFMGDNLIGCAPLRVEFSSLGDGSEFYWEFGDGTNDVGIDPVHVYTVTGLYTVTLTVTSAEGCINSETYESYVDVENTPVAQFNYSPYEIDVSDTRVELTNNSLYATTYEWDFGDGSANTGEVSPSHEYPVEGDVSYRISLTATSDNGCVDIAEQVIRINDKLIYYIPNTFTPDGDTFNETFTPVFASGLDIFDYHIMVFNRWGELVFESYDANFGWNGMYGDQGLVEDGVYIYKIEFGETMTDKKHYIEGHVVLLK